MRVGISLSSSLTAETPARAAAMMVERAATAYQAGLASLSVGDHHGQPHWYQQNTPTLGRLLAEWPDRPAGCLFLLPLWHPLLVAEHVGTLSAHLDAPFILQTGVGAGARQFASMGADLTRRGADTDEAIRVIRLLLSGQEAESERFAMGPTTLALRPDRPVEWWIGGHARASLRRAATVGTAWYGGPGLSRKEAADLIAAYRDTCDGTGAAPRSIVRRDALVLADRARADAEAAAIVDGGYRGIPLERLLVGDPASVTEELAAWSDVGCDDIIVRCMSPQQDVALETIELLGGINR